MFSDESYLTREVIFNRRNYHIWANENPYDYIAVNYQYRFNVNLWTGIMDNILIGPFELPARVNGEIYLNFLQNALPVLLENLPLEIRRNIYFQHDSAPAHSSRNVTNFLNLAYPNRRIGRGGPQNWPARSPDLTPLDFFLWGHLKNYIYREPIQSRRDLNDRILETLATITPDMIHAGQHLLRRAKLYIEMDGAQFEHLL